MDFEPEIRAYIIREVTEYIEEQINEGIDLGLNYLKETYEDEDKKGLISTSPLVRIMAYEVNAMRFHDITMLLKGNLSFGFFKSIFVRIELIMHIDKTLDQAIENCTVELLTVMGDVTIYKEKVFETKIGFGIGDQGEYFVGHGALKLLPPNGFGLDVLGGLSDDGFFMDAGLDIPVPIPLGSTGLGLAGVGGIFAYNFEPKLEKDGIEISDPTAKDYVAWAKNANAIDLWQADSENITSLGLGLNADLITLVDNGNLLALRPIGLSVLTPGPIFILGGKGTALMGFVHTEGYVVIDIGSSSFAMSLTTNIDIVDSSKIKLIESRGTIESYFSFEHPSDWYMNFGTDTKRIPSKMVQELITSKMYLMMNNNRVKYGSGLSIELEAKWWKIKFYAKAGASIDAMVGRNPVVVKAELIIFAELGIKIWRFTFSLNVKVDAIATTPRPTQLNMIFSFRLPMPWPISDITASSSFSLGDDDPTQVEVDLQPILSTSGLGLLHELSGKQWSFDREERGCWPDTIIAIPFSSRMYAQNTDIAILNNIMVKSTIEGGYTVTHTLKKLTLLDGDGLIVKDINAVWVHGTGGDSDKVARLHIMGTNPYAWLNPHIDMNTIDSTQSVKIIDQFFGHAPRYEKIEKGDQKIFNNIGIIPEFEDAELMRLPIDPFETRSIKIEKFKLLFLHNIKVKRAILFFVAEKKYENELFVVVNEVTYQAEYISTINHEYILLSVTVEEATPMESLSVEAYKTNYLLLQGIRYYQIDAIPARVDCQKRILPVGKYTIKVEGESKAEHPIFLDVTLPWGVEKEFKVIPPETLRPYIRSTTIGDSRIFGGEESPWNPTTYGYGFPLYRAYIPMIRFKVPYMDKIFPELLLELQYEKTNETLVYRLHPQKETESENFLPEVSKKWEDRHCQEMLANQMLVLPELVEYGPAHLQILHEDPLSGEAKSLDRWACYISKFKSFRDHVTLHSTTINTLYYRNGKEKLYHCSPIREREPYRVSNRRLDERVERYPHRLDLHRARDLRRVDDLILVTRKEYDEVPPNWGHSTGAFVLNQESGLAFVHFAQNRNIRFNNLQSLDKLDGINDIARESKIELIADDLMRPYALWLRTPEPVDWRRVTARLTIQHLIEKGLCPHKHASRLSLNLDIKILPSPDASSAFLVGFFNHEAIMLPMGDYHLELEFNQQKADLPYLKAEASLSSPKERVILKFIQPSGQHWPTPPSKIIDVEIFERYKDLLDKLLRELNFSKDRVIFHDIQLLKDNLEDMKSSEVDTKSFVTSWRESDILRAKIAYRISKRRRLHRYRRFNPWNRAEATIQKIKTLHHVLQMQINKF